MQKVDAHKPKGTDLDALTLRYCGRGHEQQHTQPDEDQRERKLGGTGGLTLAERKPDPTENGSENDDEQRLQ